MAANDTIRVTERGVPGEKRIHKADFDATVHVLLKEGEEEGDLQRAARTKELKAMSAEDVREVATAAGLEPSTKAENIKAILGAEFPES